MSVDQLIRDLEDHINQLESGQQVTSPVDWERIYDLDTLAQQAINGSYQLSIEQMREAAEIGLVFADQVLRLSPAELEDRLETARKERDTVTLYLLSKYAPSESIRLLAETLGTDQETLAKIDKARSLATRARYLESLEGFERERLARSLGYQVASKPAQQQSPDLSVEQHMERLRVSGYYSL